MKTKNWKYRVSIVGVGNYIMGDDGAGIHLIKKLRKEKISTNVNLIEVGTAPINYIGEISRSKEIIAVDAVRGGEKPGTIYRLNLTDLKETSANDTHGCSLFEVIRMAQSMTGYPEKVVIYGIEPKIINLNPNISEPVENSVEKIKNIITDIIFIIIFPHIL